MKTQKQKQTILTHLPTESNNELDKFDCHYCFDTNFEFLDDSGTLSATPKRCRHLLDKIAGRKKDLIPAIYSKAKLENLKADVQRHASQPEIIRKLKNKPDGSYLFTGTHGTGKTHLMWCLYNYAVSHHVPIYAGTLSSLIAEYQAGINASKAGERFTYSIEASQLRQNHTGWALMLDDIDKAKPSLYVADKLFELVDAAYCYQHQLVITTNLTPRQLMAHFQDIDNFGQYGGAIVRRILETTETIEFF